MIPDMTEGENWDKFYAGLKREIKIEVMKSTSEEFETAARIALCVGSAIWGVNNSFPAGNENKGNPVGDDVVPMELGNV